MTKAKKKKKTPTLERLKRFRVFFVVGSVVDVGNILLMNTENTKKFLSAVMELFQRDETVLTIENVFS